MTLEDMLKSRLRRLHFELLIERTDPHAVYPGKLPARRAGILRYLETLDARTRDRLDTLIDSLRSEPFAPELEPAVAYMLRQRMRCALDTLQRLVDAAPSPEWLCTASLELAAEDHWLLIGLWNEFGMFWLQNLAWRIAHGLPE